MTNGLKDELRQGLTSKSITVGIISLVIANIFAWFMVGFAGAQYRVMSTWWLGWDTYLPVLAYPFLNMFFIMMIINVFQGQLKLNGSEVSTVWSFNWASSAMMMTWFKPSMFWNMGPAAYITGRDTSILM